MDETLIEAGIHLKKMNILMIENNDRFSNVVVEAYLKDHDVTIVPSIEGARQKLNTYRYDLFLVDYDLDDGKGDCIVKEIKQISHHYPIIAISAFESKNDQLMAAGADFKCSKLHFSHINHIGPLTYKKSFSQKDRRI